MYEMSYKEMSKCPTSIILGEIFKAMGGVKEQLSEVNKDT